MCCSASDGFRSRPKLNFLIDPPEEMVVGTDGGVSQALGIEPTDTHVSVRLTAPVMSAGGEGLNPTSGRASGRISQQRTNPQL